MTCRVEGRNNGHDLATRESEEWLCERCGLRGAGVLRFAFYVKDCSGMEN